MSLDAIRIVLVRPQHPGNIGACARAMKNMGLSDLTLVAPLRFPAEEAFARAAGADDILAGARVVSDVRQAIADCVWVAATSARERTIEWPQMGPREVAHALWARSAPGPVALLFGAERTGLTNEEVDFAQVLVQIPANPDFSSLNLAAAVQILCYEIHLASLAVPTQSRRLRPMANQEQFHQFLDHMERTLLSLGFLQPTNPRKLMRRLTRLFFRALPDETEIHILRGILSAIDRPYPPRK